MGFLPASFAFSAMQATAVSGIDLSVNFGNILTIVVMAVGGIFFFFLDEMKGLKDEMTKMTEVLIVQGRMDERITAMDQRMVGQGKRLDDTVRRLNTFLDMRAVQAIEDDDAEH